VLIGSPETLDRVIRNALAVRLGDPALAADVYADLHRQVVRSPERRYDARASISLSPWPDGPASGRGAMLVATIRWEYRVTPASALRRFICVADVAEYRRLVDEAKDGVRYFEPIADLDAASGDAFELVQFTVDGAPLPIRRLMRANSQTYSVELRPEHLGRQVKVAYTYRALVQQHGHLLYLDVSKPTRGLTVELNYADTGIRFVNALDFIASAQQPHTLRSPRILRGRSVSIGFDGWVFPKSGVALPSCGSLRTSEERRQLSRSTSSRSFDTGHVSRRIGISTFCHALGRYGRVSCCQAAGRASTTWFQVDQQERRGLEPAGLAGQSVSRHQ
jgi:hypothetical protein